MRKLKLSVEELRIESFDTAAVQREKGTVFGEECTCYTNCTCPGCPTCEASCDLSCDPSCSPSGCRSCECGASIDVNLCMTAAPGEQVCVAW